MLEILFSRVFLTSCLSVALVCATASLWGVFLLLAKKSMLPETLSHASYPGLLVGVLVSQALFASAPVFWIIVFGVVFALLGNYGMLFLEKNLRMNRDSALCFILVSFFALGVLFSGYIKDFYPILYNRVNAYLYGQAATLKESDAVIAGVVFALSILFLSIFRRQIAISIFDRDYAQTCGIPFHFISIITLCFTTLIVVVGVRSVGIILISAMFVAPALTSRQFTDDLKAILWGGVVVGFLSGIIGSLLSVSLSFSSSTRKEIILPTGPLVVLVAGVFVFFALIFSPLRGVVFCFCRRLSFRLKLQYEHFLKAIWYASSEGKQSVSYTEIVNHKRFLEYFGRKKFPRFWFKYFLFKKLVKHCEKGRLCLTPRGKELSERLIRKHRLWEAYMVNSLDFSKDDVHILAEEIEHVLTDDLESELVKMLNNPRIDPHNSIIPEVKEDR